MAVAVRHNLSVAGLGACMDCFFKLRGLVVSGGGGGGAPIFRMKACKSREWGVDYTDSCFEAQARFDRKHENAARPRGSAWSGRQKLPSTFVSRIVSQIVRCCPFSR